MSKVVNSQYVSRQDFAYTLHFTNFFELLEGSQERSKRIDTILTILQKAKSLDQVPDKLILEALDMFLDHISDKRLLSAFKVFLNKSIEEINPHKQVFKRALRMVELIEDYLEKAYQGKELSPDILQIKEDGILFTKG